MNATNATNATNFLIEDLKRTVARRDERVRADIVRAIESLQVLLADIDSGRRIGNTAISNITRPLADADLLRAEANATQETIATVQMILGK